MPAASSAMSRVPRGDWVGFCEGFTSRHCGWLVTIELTDGGGHRTVVTAQPLKAVSAEVEEAQGGSRILISTGADPLERTLQAVKEPVELSLVQTEAGADKGLRIESKDGSVTSVRFRAAAKPETLDGYVPVR